MDREKVIKGLECCTMECTYEHPFRCKGCPYSQDDAPCEALPVMRDALVLLKENESKAKWVYYEDEYGQDGYKCSECGFFVSKDALALLKAQEVDEPKQVDLYGKDEWWGFVCVCPYCKAEWMSATDDTHFCPNCGRKVKWDDNRT